MRSLHFSHNSGVPRPRVVKWLTCGVSQIGVPSLPNAVMWVTETGPQGLQRYIPGKAPNVAGTLGDIEHKAFLDLYKDQHSQEGLPP